MPALLWLPRGRMAVDAMRIPICALMHVLDVDLQVGDYLGNVLHLYCLIRLHAASRAIADYYDMIFAAGELGMAIITLGRLYFELSYRLAPNVVAPVQHGRQAGNGVICALVGSHLSSGVGSKASWARLLVDF
jgi:hypothetical protein